MKRKEFLKLKSGKICIVKAKDENYGKMGIVAEISGDLVTMRFYNRQHEDGIDKSYPYYLIDPI